MSTLDATTPGLPARARLLGWPLFLAWTILYLLLMAHGGWAWSGRSALEFGTPSAASLQDFGAAVPTKVHAGAWQRLFLSPWLQQSLLGLLLLGWFWSSCARTLVSCAGLSRTWILFVLGGCAGALAQAWAHPTLDVPGGAGPFDAIAAAVGAQLVWGLRSRSTSAPRVRNSALMSILVVGALSWYFTKGTDRGATVRAMAGFEAMAGACLAGALAMACMRPRHLVPSAGAASKAVALLLLGAVLAAAAVQAPLALASGQRGEAHAFLKTLQGAEATAASLRDQRDATSEKRNALQRRLEQVLAHPFLEGYEGADAVRAYIEAMRAYTQPVRLPYMARDPCRRAFREMYDTYEAPLRERVGLPSRSRSEKYWERD
jgi:membrane associated rhomboid family serine protease